MKFSAGVLTISDRASSGVYEDKSGKVLVELLEEFGLEVRKYEIVADDFESIREKLLAYTDEEISLILTSGGTGFSQRDITPRGKSFRNRKKSGRHSRSYQE